MKAASELKSAFRFAALKEDIKWQWNWVSVILSHLNLIWLLFVCRRTYVKVIKYYNWPLSFLCLILSEWARNNGHVFHSLTYEPACACLCVCSPLLQWCQPHRRAVWLRRLWFGQSGAFGARQHRHPGQWLQSGLWGRQEAGQAPVSPWGLQTLWCGQTPGQEVSTHSNTFTHMMTGLTNQKQRKTCWHCYICWLFLHAQMYRWDTDIMYK